MSAYVSATFEKDALPTSGQIRIITRILDQGDFPPSPSSTYFPTDPDSLQEFLVGEWVNDFIGERFLHVATLIDYTGVAISSLTTFEDSTTDFIVAAVLPGDLMSVVIVDPEVWTSDEYPGTSPFIFEVVSVLNAQQVVVSQPFPSFMSNLSWSIAAHSLNGSSGVTRRSIVPFGGGGPVQFRDWRFTSYFSNMVASENYILTVKNGMTQLATAVSGVSALADENFTGQS